MLKNQITFVMKYYINLLDHILVNSKILNKISIKICIILLKERKVCLIEIPKILNTSLLKNKNVTILKIHILQVLMFKMLQ